MIGVVLSLFLWSGAAEGGAGGEVLAPGSLEDCLAWRMADLETAPPLDRPHLRVLVSSLMNQHFQQMIERGAPTADILRRQRRLYRIAQARPGPEKAKAERAVCLKNFPDPSYPKAP